jgi:hypothetical protein
MPAPQLPAFDPHDVPESNATSYPEPHSMYTFDDNQAAWAMRA